MKTFFKTLLLVQIFTLALRNTGCAAFCPHCQARGYLVSHGFTYTDDKGNLEPTGKRVFCSNRYGRKGCGRTTQLYLASRIPFMRHSTAVVFNFLSTLIQGYSVASAYVMATAQDTHRHAWRWIQRLLAKTQDLRSLLPVAPQTTHYKFSQRTQGLQLLINTFAPLFDQLPCCPCANLQLKTQAPLLHG